MAGHSKWANIKFRKAAQDKKRGKLFTKIIRDLVTAARQGGGDADSNPGLRVALDKAKAANMTKDVVERAIKRGTGELEGADYVEKTYEGYGPSGVAVLVTSITDNSTRTVTNVRTAFNKNGGNMGNDGAVAWMFEQSGFILYPSSIGGEDDAMEAAIEAGASDFEAAEEFYKITTEVADFGSVRDALAGTYGDAQEADLTYNATNMQAIEDLETAKKVQKLVDALEDDDDVQDVFTNMELSDELAEQLAGE